MVTSAISRMGKSPEEGIKAPVKTSTTTQITLFGTGQTLNGVLTGTGDRVLVKDQTVEAENGTYMVGPDAWERTTDMNAADDLANGQLIVDSNTSVVYSIQYSGAWDPGATPLNFLVLVGSMPSQIILTNSSTIDLVDHDVALVTGALDPSVSQHLEYDHSSVQSKSDDTTAAVLNLNPEGGAVIAAGVDIGALASAFVAHDSDGTIHFTMGAISITASQVSDFDSAVAANAAVAANTAKVSNVSTALSIGTHAIGTLGITSDGGADDVVLPSFTATLAGLAPGSAGGAVNFLRADGAWAAPPGSGNNFTAVVETTTARTAVAFEAVFCDDDTAGAIQTITLPAGSTDAMVLVKKIGSSFDVIVDGDSAETIDGAATFTLTAQYSSLTLMWNGTEWSIV